jgi:mRNA interferase MazF
MIAGDVVLIRFPFSDLSGAKLRPVVVVAVAGPEEFIACQITSKRIGDRRAIELTGKTFAQGGLRVDSYVRPWKLFTSDRKAVVKRVARLHDTFRDRVRAAVIDVIRNG